jgi:hypothetical protein
MQPAPSSDDGNWRYTPAPEQPLGTPVQPQGSATSSAYQPAPPVQWTASEFVAHHKSVGWYVVFVLAAVVVLALVYVVTKDIISVVAIAILGLLFGISAARKPRVLGYQLDGQGLTAGQKFYPYSEFKSFSVSIDGAFASLDLLPLKRFALPVSVHYDPKDESHILEVIGKHLPFEQRGDDVADRLARRIRF